jgi:hypothetical protein
MTYVHVLLRVQTHALSIVCARALKHSRDAGSMCSLLQVSKSVAAAIIKNVSRTLSLRIALSDEDSMVWRVWQAHWLSKYGGLVGELELVLPDRATVSSPCAALEPLVAAVLPRLQLRHLSVTALRPWLLLQQVHPMHLTSLDVQWQSSRTSWPLPASLSTLSNLQQLSIGRGDPQSCTIEKTSYSAGFFAGLPSLTQLVVAFQLPDDAYGELPCQLKRLMLTDYNGIAITHLQQLSALALVNPEGPGQELAAAVTSLRGLQHLTVGLSKQDNSHIPPVHYFDILTAMTAVPVLCDVRLNLEYASQSALMATIAQLTNLTCLVLERVDYCHDQDILVALQPLTRLEQLCYTTRYGVRSLDDLFTKHLTRLQCLHVVEYTLGELVLSQVLAAASGLTSLTLGFLKCPDRDLGMIACSAPRLRELTLLLSCEDDQGSMYDAFPPDHAMDVGTPMTPKAILATLRSPRMLHLQRLTLCGSLVGDVSAQKHLDSFARVRPNLEVRCHPDYYSVSTNYQGCLARHWTPAVKIWDCA